MGAVEDSDSRGDEPYIFPDDKPRQGDLDGDGEVYILLMNDDGSPKTWKLRGADNLERNTIWAPSNYASRLRRTKRKNGDPNGVPPLPLPIKILALRGE